MNHDSSEKKKKEREKEREREREMNKQNPMFQEQQSRAPLLKEGVLSRECYESLQQQGIATTDDSFKYAYSASQFGYGNVHLLCLTVWLW